jgi:hypothetical protein
MITRQYLVPNRCQVVLDDVEREELSKAWESLRPYSRNFSDFAREALFTGIEKMAGSVRPDAAEARS